MLNAKKIYHHFCIFFVYLKLTDYNATSKPKIRKNKIFIYLDIKKNKNAVAADAAVVIIIVL